MMVSGIPQCHSCGEPAGLSANGEVLVACHECNLPVCRPCFDYENAEGGQSCLRCGTPYIRPSGFLSIHFFYYAIGLFLFIFFTCCATVRISARVLCLMICTILLHQFGKPFAVLGSIELQC